MPGCSCGNKLCSGCPPVTPNFMFELRADGTMSPCLECGRSFASHDGQLTFPCRWKSRRFNTKELARKLVAALWYTRVEVARR